MESQASSPYVPALRFKWLTKYYDIIVGFTTREATFKAALLNQAAIQPGERVVDIGCGTGTLAIRAKELHRDADIAGVDGDPEILSIAHDKARLNKVTVQFDQALSYSLPYGDESTDVVTTSLFFHHLNDEEKSQTATEALRILKPGGRLLVADWGEPSNQLMRALFFLIQILDGFDNTRANVNGELPAIIQRVGFTEVRRRLQFDTIFGTLILSEYAKRM